jgi:hypothetical protein
MVNTKKEEEEVVKPVNKYDNTLPENIAIRNFFFGSKPIPKPEESAKPTII